MKKTPKKPHTFTTTRSKIAQSIESSSSPHGFSVQDMATFIMLSKKNYLHISINPISGNTLY